MTVTTGGLTVSGTGAGNLVSVSGNVLVGTGLTVTTGGITVSGAGASNSVNVAANITAGTGLTVTTGGITVSGTGAGNLVSVAGNITSGTGMTITTGGLTVSGTNNVTVSSSTNQITLYGGNGQVSAASFNATSDQRIKTNIFEINTLFALNTLRKIEPVSFEYIDKTTSSTPNWGFIAQQVQDVLDFTVQKQTNYIPNIFENVFINNNVITLIDKFTSDISLCNTPIKIQLRDISDNLLYRTIDKILDSKSFTITEAIDASNNQLFLYGQEVDNYLSINKDSIFTIATAAVQQLDIELQEAKQTIKDQTTTIQVLQTNVSELKSQMEILIKRINSTGIP